MAAKPKRSAASAKSVNSSSSSTAMATHSKPTPTPTLTPARFDMDPGNAITPALSSSRLPDAMQHSLYKERPGPMLSKVQSGDPDHRPNQPYQGTAPLRQVQRSPSLNTAQSHQPPFVQGVFSPQAGLQSPYLNNPQHYPQHPQTNEGAYYSSNPSPRSTASGAYYSSDKPESMATATATMQQRTYPQIYHTPQSNSPASVTSPQTHDHGRPMYPQQPQQMQPMYQYPNYQHMNQVHHQSPYGGTQHQPQMNPQPMMPYPQNQNSLPQGTMTSQPPTIQSSPIIKNESQHYSQTPQNQPGHMPQRHQTGTASSNIPLQQAQPPGPPAASNAAPGPIPATTPLVVRQDGNGVQWIAFEYSRDRVKMEYTIRCDVESVNANQLSQEFKGENCVYPRACVPKDQYKGNRLAYETDCNQVGWALAELNPCLRGKRGLIQRAVDSWRNSNQDPRLRSRRVRRQAKMNNRSKVGALSAQNTGPQGPPGSGGSGHPGAGSMNVPSARPPAKISNSSQQGHHGQHDISATGQESMGVPSQYSTTPGLHRAGSTPQHLTSPTDLRQVHTFPSYQAYPTTTLGPSMAPSIQGGMMGYSRPGGNATMASKKENETQYDIELYGDLPEAKRRKFVVVEDAQKETRVRVKVTLDQVELSELPDSFRVNNSLFPRAYFPVHMQSSTESTCASRFVGDDVEEMDDGPPTVGRITVPCPLTDGDGNVEVSQLSRNQRDRERKINELGYRMAWGQINAFDHRPIFLGKSCEHFLFNLCATANIIEVDAYRKKQHIALTSEGQKLNSIPPHLEIRPGKRQWRERMSQTHRLSSSATADDA